ncbi:hypothetical protein K439DRAFT_1660982 [Ramaria rubella]|nr:hypothetical protein K439DRAFT_1660982 [Ramaria rubella]
MEHDDSMEAHSDDLTSPTSPTSGKDNRKRSSRACDQCRKAKSRCDPAADDGPCKSCVFTGTACTFQGPSQKRGPPKGYLSALETRLHEAEALLGAIISSPQAEQLVAVLSKDTLAGQIITRVNKSVFGALGRPRSGQPQAGPSRGRRRPDKERQRMSNSEILYSRENGSPVFTTPSYAWQDHLNEQLAAREPQFSETTLCGPSGAASRSDSIGTSQWEGNRRQKRRIDLGDSSKLDLPGNNNHDVTRPASINDFKSESDSAVNPGIGELCLDKNRQVRYLGQSSGLSTLSQCPRSDALYSQQMWRLPRNLSYAVNGVARSPSFDELEYQVRLPSRATQEYLLRQYFHYVHPVLPIVNREEFWDEWTSMHKYDSSGPARLLLLAMFALASQYSDPAESTRSNQESSIDSNTYVEDAKPLLDLPFVSSRLSTCQALLLLGYRAIGISGMTDASLFLMLGIQMAIDLGLNRHAEQWARDGSCIFSEDALRIRRSVWYGCIVLDVYIAAQLGRPLRIRREDYDIRMPDINSQEDFQLWMPYRNVPSAQGYNALPGRITSCFRSLCSLAEIFSIVLHRLYAINPRCTAAQRHADSFELDQKLQRWYMELPESLRSTSSPVPPPQIMCLHMLYWCAVLLLHRSFTHMPDRDDQFRSRRAFDMAAAAATNLTNLVHSYNITFGLRQAPTLLMYYILAAGYMHIAILRLHPEDIQAKIGLSQGLTCLEELKEIWPAASQAYELLKGAEVVRKTPPVASTDQSRKRNLDESPSITSSGSHSELRSESVLPQSSNHGIPVFHPSHFMEMTHSLGLDPSGLNSAFETPAYRTWPSNDSPFAGMQEDAVRRATMVVRHKGPG